MCPLIAHLPATFYVSFHLNVNVLKAVEDTSRCFELWDLEAAVERGCVAYAEGATGNRGCGFTASGGAGVAAQR